ncbi:MAG: LysR substrate-binding domain-containing protein [Blautia faecicola]
MELLKTHQIDLGFMEALPGETDHTQEPFAKDRTITVAAPDYHWWQEHARFEDLKEENFLCGKREPGT